MNLENIMLSDMKVKVVIVQSCPTLCDPMNWSPAASLSTGSSRQEYWSGLPCPLQGIFPPQGLNLGLLHCRQILLSSEAPGKPLPSKRQMLQDYTYIIYPA